MPSQSEIESQAQIVWDYHLMNHSLKKSDCIFVLCSNDPRVAEHGAKLYLENWAPLLVFSGGEGAFTEGLYDCPEAEHFAKVAIEMGVPKENIIIEPKATNTGENIKFTQKLLDEQKLNPQSFIVVQKPFMERRSYATFKKHWPDKDLIISSPPFSFLDYPNDNLSKEHVINAMVGDLQRIKEYPKLGFQISQEIPNTVWEAFEKLASWGFNTHLIKQ